MTYSYTSSKLICLALTLICCHSLELYQFVNVNYGISLISNGNDICGISNSLPSGPITIYGRQLDNYRVCSYGAIYFGYGDLMSLSYVSNSFPNIRDFLVVAPFWADVDTTLGNGEVYIGLSTNMTEFEMAAKQINDAFSYLYSVSGSDIETLIVATWSDVGYYDKQNDKRNTFQCVIAATKDDKTFSIFLYSQIQWLKATSNNRLNSYAHVGFIKGEQDDFYQIPESGKMEVESIANRSNVDSTDPNYKGVYVFDITGSSNTIMEPKGCNDTDTGQHYKSGESFKVGCSTSCICEPGGNLSCIEQECVYRATGRVNGDPHYETFDSKHYNFQGTGEYILTKLCSNEKFIITATNIPSTRIRAHASLANEVTIYIRDIPLTIILGRDNIIINNVPQTMSDGVMYDHEGIKVERIGGNTHVFLITDGLKLFWDGDFRVTIEVSDHLKGKLCGLLGNYSNTQEDDLMKPDGTITSSITEFGDSWAYNSGDSRKRDVQVDISCSDNPFIVSEAQERCSVIEKGIFNVCNKFLNPSQFIENCVYDYLCCGDEERESCYCDNLATYAAACADIGAQPSGWRRLYCSVECPNGMVYQQCGTLCPPTCDNIENIDEVCVGGCAEGCFCPTGQVLFEGSCVNPAKCKSCTFMNVTYEHGEQIQPNCSSRCTCRNREFFCESQSCSEKGSTCIVYGNSHYQTFDLRSYDFQGDCEFILATPCDNDNFSIIAKSTAHNQVLSSITEVTILVPNQDLTVVLGEGDGGTITIDNVLQPNFGNVAVMLSRDVEVLRAGGHPHVILNEYNIRIFWDGKDRVQITAANVWKNKLCGLCGNYNDTHSDDFTLPNNQSESKKNDFIKFWSSYPNKSCDSLADAPGCFGLIRAEAETRCRVIQSGIFEQCNDILDPNPFIRDCVFDYCNCKSTKETCYCNILAAYASTCSSLGIIISNWREFYCSPQCPQNMIYHQCGPFCSSTCINNTATCYSGCAEGCFCPDEYLTDDYGKCKKKCPTYTSEGDEFFVGFFKNRFGLFTNPETIPPVLWVTTQESTPVDFTVSTKAGILAENQAYPGSTTFISIPLNLIVFDSTQSNATERFKGISIKAESGKTIAVFGQNEQLASNDAFLALPLNPIPRERHHEYILASVHGDSGTAIQSKDSVALIVGTQDKTEITILPSTTTGIIRNNLAPRGFFSKTFNDSLNTITIDQYQTFYLQVRGKDISGTRVISNKPITVFSGHECANIPFDSQPCDMLVEQMPPIDTWGTVVVTVPFKTRKSGDLIKVIASQDSTTVFVTKTDIVNGKVSSIPAFTLNAGEYKELVIKEFSIIRSNNPIAVFQFSRSYRSDNVINSDPFMVFVPPDQQYHNSYVISTAPFNPQLEGSVAGRTVYMNYTNIAVPVKYFNTSLMTINNQAINATDFKPIRYSDGSVWGYGAQLMLNAGAQVVKHQDPNATFSLTVYGFSNQMSYGYTGGSKLQSYVPARSCNFRPIAGSVAISTGAVEITFTADDSRATFRCKLDRTRFVRCTSPWTQKNVAEGKHEITIEAKCSDDGKKMRRKFKFKVD